MGTTGGPDPRAGWSLGSVGGIPLRLRPSALLSAGVLALLLAPAVLELRPDLAVPLVAAICLLGGFALLGSILAHELAHAVTARGLGLEVRDVTLLALGGVTRMIDEPEDPATEAYLALAGPSANLLIAAGAAGLALAFGRDRLGGALLGFLAEANLLIGVINLLPTHPLDGGALLRALLWWRTGDRARALVLAARVARVTGWVLTTAGVAGLLATAGGTGSNVWLWIAILGVLVGGTARVAELRARVYGRLAGLRVLDLTRRAGWRGEASWTVSRVVAEVSRSQAEGLVLDQGEVVGAFGPVELADLPSGSWEQTTLGEAMRVVTGQVRGDDPLTRTLPRFADGGDSLLTVVDDGEPIGTLHAADVLARLRLEAGR